MFFSKFIIKPSLYLTIGIIFLISTLVLWKTGELEMIKQVETLKPVDPIPKVIKLRNEGKICEALDYIELFRNNDRVRSNLKLESLYNELLKTRESYYFRTGQIFKGAVSGSGACAEAAVSAVVTDFLIIGDVRDLVIEEAKRFRGEDTDEFIEALAGMGIVLSAATYASGGGAAPVKGSLSALKIAKRMGKLSKPMQKSLIKAFKQVKRTKSLRKLSRMSRSLYNLASTPNVRRNLLYILSKSDDIKDITRIERAAKVYGKNTVKFMKLGGDESIDIARKFAKNRDLTKAMNRAVQYGEDGTRILRKTGPTKFLTYLRIAKYGERAIRTTYQGRLNFALLKVAEYVPKSALMVTSFASGLFLLFIPAAILLKIGLLPRTRFKKA